MLTVKILQPDLIEIRVEGKITETEVERAYKEIENALPPAGKVRLIEYIGPLDGVTPSAMWEDLKEGLPMWDRLSKVAIVADQGWVDTMASAVDAITGVEIKAFTHAEEPAARNWVGA